jgi:eukaryotic-like serine/threonine-protein kinase
VSLSPDVWNVGGASHKPMAVLDPPQRFGKYVLIEKIGQGGMAEIFKAKSYGSAGFEKLLVIKRILPHLVKDPNFVDMFVNEAKLTVSLSHANIIQVYELNEVDGQYYIAMEFVHGQDLFNIIDRGFRSRIPLPEDLAVHVVIEVLKGLEYAHRAKHFDGRPMGLVHRDISPTNVFISYEGDVKLADFGIAKANIQRRQTQSQTIKGTLGYMSPEQVMGKELDRRSDIFATGIMLYELVTGTKPFSGKGDLEILLKIRDGKFVTPAKVRHDISPTLERIVLKAMAMDAEDRYQEAGEYYEDLADYLFASGMRTSPRKLATYMRNLFAEELESEEAQRLESAEKQKVAAALGTQPQGATPTGSTGPTPVVAWSRTGVDAPPAPPPPNAQYYVRDARGQVRGPMDADALYEIVRARQIAVADEVSLDGQRWRPVYQFPFPAKLVRAVRDLSAPVASDGAPVISDAGEDAMRGAGQAPANVAPAAGGAVAAGGGGGSANSAGLVIPLKVAVKPRYSGLFSEVTPVKLFYRFAASRESGRLQLTRGDVAKQVFLRDGLPEYVESNVSSEMLGEFLVRKGAINREQLQSALNILKDHGGRIGDALLHLRALPSHELYRLLASQVRTKILEVFGWKDGYYAFFPGERTGGEVIPLGIGSFAILADGVRANLDRFSLAPYFRDRLDVPLKARRNTALDVEALKLTPSERELVKKVDGRTTMSALCGEAAANSAQLDEIYRTIYLLSEVELLTIG